MQTPVTVKIKFKSATLEQFIERYSVDISQGGIFVRTPKPLSVGTSLKFEFQLQDGSPLLSGDGTVAWVREPDPTKVNVSPGMGVRFEQLPASSQQMLNRVLDHKAHAQEFSDQPTRVATEDDSAFGAAEPSADHDFSPALSSEVAKSGLDLDLGGADVDFSEESGQTPTPAGVGVMVPLSAPVKSAPEPEEMFEFGGTPSEDRSGLNDGPTIAARPNFGADNFGMEMVSGGGGGGGGSQRLEDILFTGETTRGYEDDDVGAQPIAPAAQLSAEQYRPSGDYATVGSSRSGSNKMVLIGIVLVVIVGVAAGAVYYFKVRAANTPAVAPVAPTPPATKKAVVQAPPPKAAEPKKVTVAIKVESTPAGAKILIDGVDTGKVTPIDLDDLATDKALKITADLPGKKLQSQSVTPKSGETIRFDLADATKRVVIIDSTPPKAQVLIKGRKVGVTPLTWEKPLEDGAEIKVKLSGYEEASVYYSDIKGWVRHGDGEEQNKLTVELVSKEDKKRAGSGRSSSNSERGKPPVPVETPTAAPEAEKVAPPSTTEPTDTAQPKDEAPTKAPAGVKLPSWGN